MNNYNYFVKRSQVVYRPTEDDTIKFFRILEIKKIFRRIEMKRWENIIKKYEA